LLPPPRIEKICENSDYYNVIDQVDPLEYVQLSIPGMGGGSSRSRSSWTCRWPRRAEYIRVLSGELLRIASHTLIHGLPGPGPGRPDAHPVQPCIERDEIVEMLAA